jgi:hypothetical protein
MISSAPFLPDKATSTPQPEWTRIPIAADFIWEYFTPGCRKSMHFFAHPAFVQ